MKSSLTWALLLALSCIFCMVLFNQLGASNEIAREDYKTYSAYAFDCLKVIFGMIIGALTEKFHTKQQEKAYQERIQNLQSSSTKKE